MNSSANEKENLTIEGNLQWTSNFYRETRQVIEAVFYGGVSSVVCLIGIPTNILNCLVFGRQGLQDRMNLCLFSLAFVDLSYLLCAVVMYPVGSFLTFENERIGDEYQTKFITALFGVSLALRTTSRFIGVIIAVERCVCVVASLIASTIMRTSVMAITIVVAFVLFQACYILIPLSYQAHMVVVGEDTFWMYIETQFVKDNKTLVRVLAYTVLGFVVPVTTLFILLAATAITVIKLRAAIRWRKKTSSGTASVSQQEALTVMLVIVSCIQIVAMAPSVAMELTLWFIADLFDSETFFDVLKILSAVGNVFPLITSCLNFFVYYCQSSRFRCTLRQLPIKKIHYLTSFVSSKENIRTEF